MCVCVCDITNYFKIKTHVNKAIVKMKADEFGTNSDVILCSLLNHPTYNVGHIRACASVKRSAQLSVGPRKQQNRKQNCQFN